MDELTLLKEFRSAVPSPSEAARARARAAIAPPTRRSRRRFALALAAGVALAVVLATSAFAFGPRLYDLIVGTPAPQPVKREVSLFVRPDPEVLRQAGARLPGVDVDATRAAAVLRSSVGPVYLWVAPNRYGGPCGFIQVVRATTPGGRPMLIGGMCYPRKPAVVGGVWAAKVGGRTVLFVSGRTRPGVAKVEIRSRGGMPRSVPLRGRYFLAEVAVAALPATLVAGSRSGRVLQEQPLGDPTAPPPSEPPLRVGRERVAVVLRTESGDVARALAGPVRSGARCLHIALGRARPSVTGSCDVRTHGGLAVESLFFGRAAHATVLVGGLADLRIAAVRVVYEDGSSAPARLARGVFLLEVTRAHLAQGRRPRLLIGLDESGRRIASFRLGSYG
jgi:hypothetical protein